MGGAGVGGTGVGGTGVGGTGVGGTGVGGTGVGGFGYFDTVTRKYKIYSPPEILDWSISAMHLSPNDIWFALMNRGEWGSSGGKVLRFDRRTESVKLYSLFDEAVAIGFVPLHDQIAVASNFGITLIAPQTGQVQNYFLDIAPNGKLRVLEARR